LSTARHCGCFADISVCQGWHAPACQHESRHFSVYLSPRWDRLLPVNQKSFPFFYIKKGRGKTVESWLSTSRFARAAMLAGRKSTYTGGSENWGLPPSAPRFVFFLKTASRGSYWHAPALQTGNSQRARFFMRQHGKSKGALLIYCLSMLREPT